MIKGLTMDDFVVRYNGKLCSHIMLGSVVTHTYGIGDNVKTNRGISIGSRKSEVFDKYGESKLKLYDKDKDVLLKLLYFYGYLGNDHKHLKEGDKYCDYGVWADNEKSYAVFIRFYFGRDDKVKVIGFYTAYNDNKFKEQVGVEAFKNAWGKD